MPSHPIHPCQDHHTIASQPARESRNQRIDVKYHRKWKARRQEIQALVNGEEDMLELVCVQGIELQLVASSGFLTLLGLLLGLRSTFLLAVDDETSP